MQPSFASRICTDLSTGFEITFAPELASLAPSSGGERPDTSATWDSGDVPGAAVTTPALITAKSPSPIDRLSPKPSKNDKKRFSFLKRTSIQEPQHTSAGFTALPKVNGRPSVESSAAPTSPRIGQTNGNGNLHDRSGAMSPASISNEDKLQKYFGIPESQYRVASPEFDQRERHARTTSNHIQPAVPATGHYNATIVHASPPLPQQEPERPTTRQSSRSTQDGAGATSGGSSIGSRVGSVKKRLSILGIGKKASKSSVRSRGQPESLIEE